MSAQLVRTYHQFYCSPALRRSNSICLLSDVQAIIRYGEYENMPDGIPSRTSIPGPYVITQSWAANP